MSVGKNFQGVLFFLNLFVVSEVQAIYSRMKMFEILASLLMVVNRKIQN